MQEPQGLMPHATIDNNNGTQCTLPYEKAFGRQGKEMRWHQVE